MRPTLRQMQYFIAVAERRAFGPAADALAVTQPSLSKQIATMEAELGVVLFERTSRQVRLTRAGEALLGEARAVMAAASGFKQAAQRLAGDPVRRLKAGVLPSIGAYFMPRLRERLRPVMPDLTMGLMEGASRDLLARLGAGEVDFVVASLSDETGFVHQPLFDETLWICSAPDDPLTVEEGALRPEALAGRVLLTLGPEFHLTRIVHTLAMRAGAHLSEDYQGASLDAIRQMAASGAGIAVLPSLYALGEAIRDPAFRVRRIADPEAIHPVRMYWRRGSADAALFQRLADEMIAEKLKIRSERAARFQV